MVYNLLFIVNDDKFLSLVAQEAHLEEKKILLSS